MSEELELRECPFCGETYISVIATKIDLSDMRIECNGCHIEVRYSDCIKSAIDLWNKRFDDIDPNTVKSISDYQRASLEFLKNSFTALNLRNKKFNKE